MLGVESLVVRKRKWMCPLDTTGSGSLVAVYSEQDEEGTAL